MLRRIREQIGSAGLIVAVIALIAALTGGALAANGGGGSGGGEATASATGKPGPRGPRGKPGKAGPQGPQGPQGLPGANGTNGAKGDAGQPGTAGTPGTDGDDGEPGKSVKVTPIPPLELECEELGGAMLEEEGEPASATEVCNGKKGEKGEKGENGTWEGKALPVGKSQAGAWAVSGSDADTNGVLVPISFPSPLSNNIGAASGKFHNQLTDGVAFADFCKAASAVNPLTVPPEIGHLCVYGTGTNVVSAEIMQLNDGAQGANRPGAMLRIKFSAPGSAFGSWAVTGF
jgi:hypothetical protein